MTILEFFLHFSPDERNKHLLQRLKDRTKRWKYNPGDPQERQLWQKHMRANEDVLSRTSPEYAP
jgi:polyphosphate kinase 2 (PPK2 family)